MTRRIELIRAVVIPFRGETRPMARQPDFGPAPAGHGRQRRQGRRRLSCGQRFASTGPGNRIRPRCKHQDAWKSGVRDFAVHDAGE